MTKLPFDDSLNDKITFNYYYYKTRTVSDSTVGRAKVVIAGSAGSIPAQCTLYANRSSSTMESNLCAYKKLL